MLLVTWHDTMVLHNFVIQNTCVGENRLHDACLTRVLVRTGRVSTIWKRSQVACMMCHWPIVQAVYPHSHKDTEYWLLVDISKSEIMKQKKWNNQLYVLLKPSKFNPIHSLASVVLLCAQLWLVWYSFCNYFYYHVYYWLFQISSKEKMCIL